LREKLDDCSLLDMGCGFHAILSIFAHRRNCNSITAVDVIPEVVDSAEEFLLRNGVKAKLMSSDFVQNLGSEIFDIVIFNAPYIPENWGKSQGINENMPLAQRDLETTWSGGEDGLDSIRRFLEEVPRTLRPEGKILLGFNEFYLNGEYVESLVIDRQLYVEDVIRLRLIPAVVYSIRVKNGVQHA
jgi:methylase of polypeptide subunit release factors